METYRDRQGHMEGQQTEAEHADVHGAAAAPTAATVLF